MAINLKKDIEALEWMVHYAHGHLPEKWLEEEWFVNAEKAVKNLSSNLPVMLSLPNGKEIKKMQDNWLMKDIGHGINRRRAFKDGADSVIKEIKSRRK